jgi:predicted nuclease of predicted toxin-antitoxin system
VRLLLDQNISRALVHKLASLYPDSMHVADVGLDSAEDEAVWDYAANNSRLIVSKDSDFSHRSLVLGHPPKVVWVRRGNCSTREIEELLTDRREDILRFNEDDVASLLVLS